MIDHQLALIKREIWEHRSIYVTPIAIAVIVSLVSLAGMVTVSAFDKEVNMALFGASNIAGDAERRAALTVFFLGTSWVFLFALAILTTFYALDCLYAERKDKSILFWRSLPVTDAETVVSKLLTAVIVLPLFTVAAIIVTHLVNWAAALIVTVACAVWMSPLIGWFLFVSAFTKRSPMLMAFMPLIIIPIIEWIFFRSKVFASAVFGRGEMIPLFNEMDIERFFDEERMKVNEEIVSLLAHIDIGKFLVSPSVWAGVVVCGLFATAAIYVRRYRDES
jgi:ABC-2 type transport system permease protein